MSTLCGFLLVISLAAADTAPPAAPGAESPPGDPATLTATVRSYDPATRTLELVTGVGYALRLVRVSLAQECRIARQGEGAAVTDLKPGVVARVQSLRAPGREVALAVDIQ